MLHDFQNLKKSKKWGLTVPIRWTKTARESVLVQILIGAYKIDIDTGIMFNNVEQQFSMKPDQVIGNLQFDNLDYARDHISNAAGNEEFTYYMEHALVLRMSRNPLYYSLTLFVPNMVLTALRLVETCQGK